MLNGKRIITVGTRMFQNELIAYYLKQKTASEISVCRNLHDIPETGDEKSNLPTLIIDCFDSDMDGCLGALKTFNVKGYGVFQRSLELFN